VGLGFWEMHVGVRRPSTFLSAAPHCSCALVGTKPSGLSCSLFCVSSSRFPGL
jgi:hypothetical protein